MPTNNWNENGLTTTNDYDIYGQQGASEALPGSPTIDESGHLVIPPNNDDFYFPSYTLNNSTMDPEDVNSGIMTDFWTSFPIVIDETGQVFYYGKDTRLNVRGPAGISNIRFEDLTDAQKQQIKGDPGQNGINGINGINGQDGANGMSAYELWLQENGWLDIPDQHPISEFFQYLADMENALISEGAGNGSLIVNNRGQDNTASGGSAFASGYGTAANANYSSTFGKGTIANTVYGAAFGKYNEGKTSNLLEIGNGTENTRRNILEVDGDGNVVAKGNITDGSGNVLSGKVDKIQGKGLSTNDFTNDYKNFIDQYTVDESLNAGSMHPVTNAAITIAINDLRTLNGKPAITKTTSNTDLAFGFLPDTSAVALSSITWTDGLRWNPQKNILKNNSINTSTFQNITSFGTQGLSASADDQIILGKYNVTNANNFLEIGYGTVSVPKNILNLSKTGNLAVAGSITDGSGNVLSAKQNILTFDSLPTQNSSNPVTSGGLYNLFTSIGVNVSQGTLNIPGLVNLQSQVTALTARVVALEAAVAALGDPRRIPDDDYPAHIYTYGIKNDQFYIKLTEDGEDHSDDDEEEEEVNE